MCKFLLKKLKKGVSFLINNNYLDDKIQEGGYTYG